MTTSLVDHRAPKHVNTFNSQPFKPPNSAKMPVDEASLAVAFKECNLYNKPNWTDIAKKHGIDCRTLQQQYTGVTILIQEAVNTFNKKLTTEQERELVKEINCLSDAGFPPKHQTVTIIASAISGKPVGGH